MLSFNNAIRNNQIEVVRLLLEKNVNINYKPLFSSSNIKLAKKKKYIEIEKMLIDYQNNQLNQNLGY